MGMKCEMIFLGQPTSFTVIRRREPAVIDTNDPNKSQGEGITVLLRLETIQKLGIDLNYHMGFIHYTKADQVLGQYNRPQC